MSDGKILEMPGGAIMPVRPGSMSETDKARLAEIGIVVFDHAKPEEVQLIAPFAGNFPAGPVLDAAIQCLAMFPTNETSRSTDAADVMRSAFVSRLASLARNRG